MHIDTVPDAGRYDGSFGVLSGLAALDRLRGQDVRLPFAVELLAFGDEEGVRFPITMTGSRACAGTLPVEPHLAARDAAGTSMGETMRALGVDPDGLGEAAYAPETVIGLIEPHIEQGPVLEQAGLAPGVVSAIHGVRRFVVGVTGTAAARAGLPTMRLPSGAGRAVDVLVRTLRDLATDMPAREA